MDSCSVVLDRTVAGEEGKDIPRTIDLFGKSFDLFWKEAKPFCRYCKNEGHFVQKCPKLDKKTDDSVGQAVGRGESRSKPTEVMAPVQKGKSFGPTVAKAVANVSTGVISGGSGESVHAPASGTSGSGNVMKAVVTTHSDNARGDKSVLSKTIPLKTTGEPVGPMTFKLPFPLPSHPPDLDMGIEVPSLNFTKGAENPFFRVHRLHAKVGRGIMKMKSKKRPRLIQPESSTDECDAQSADEFIHHTSSTKGATLRSLMSHLASGQDECSDSEVKSVGIESDEEMEEDGKRSGVQVTGEKQLLSDDEQDMVKSGQVSDGSEEVSLISVLQIPSSPLGEDSDSVPSSL
jgi:hypothetical protein